MICDLCKLCSPDKTVTDSRSYNYYDWLASDSLAAVRIHFVAVVVDI